MQTTTRGVTGLAGVTMLFAAASAACGIVGEEADASTEADTATPVPVTTADLLGGWDPSDALMQNIRVRDWSGSPMLTADVPYGSLVFHDVDFLLSSLDDPTTTTYVASSSLRVNWGDVHCSYPIDLVVLVTRDADGKLELFLRDNRPVAFPDSLPGSAETCPPITNTWRTHPDPYKKRSPALQFDTMVDALCDAAKSRLGAVDGAKRLTTAPLAPVPANIYQASGDWQALSTPARDTTLRGSIRDVYAFVENATQGTDGPGNAHLLAAAWADRSAACALSYKSSTGGAIPLALGDVVKRAYKLSFDPYHCPELRWGADASAGTELASCNTQDAPHVDRYAQEQTLRNYLDRPAAGTPTPLGSGPAQGADIDFVALIQRLAQ
jgi:hypothetical protein